MPRINVDDIWFDDPRRSKLALKLQSYLLSDGVAINMWRLAQTYFRVGLLVPIEQYERMDYAKEFSSVGLAEYYSDGVYIKGRNDAFDWLKKRQENGRKGGQVSKNIELTQRQSKRKQTQAKPSKRNPRSLTLNTQTFSLKLYKNEIKKIENIYPTESGLSGARSQIKKQIRSDADLNNLTKAVTNYAAICKNKKPKYIKHFSTFMNDTRAGHDVFPWKDYIDMDPDMESLSRDDKEFINGNYKHEGTQK